MQMQVRCPSEKDRAVDSDNKMAEVCKLGFAQLYLYYTNTEGIS